MGFLGWGEVVTGTIYQLACKYLNIVSSPCIGVSPGLDDNTRAQCDSILLTPRLPGLQKFRKNGFAFLPPGPWWSKDPDHECDCRGSLDYLLGALHLDLGSGPCKRALGEHCSPTRNSLNIQAPIYIVIYANELHHRCTTQVLGFIYCFGTWD